MKREPAARPSKSSAGRRETHINWLKIAKYVIMAAVLLLAVGFAVLLATAKLLPGKYFAAICAALLLFAALTVFLMRSLKKRGQFWAGAALGIVMSILLAVGIIAVNRGLNAVRTVVKPNNQTVHIGIYVPAEDPAENLGDLADYTFGVLGVLDRETVDQTAAEVKKVLGSEPRISEFGSPVQLVDAMLGGDVGAVMMNAAYLDVLADTEEYEDIRSRVREITSMEVVIQREEPAAPVETEAETGEEPVGVRPFAVYISGIDSRTGLIDRSRSDVNIIATINPATHQILLVSTPRDYFVPLSISGGIKDKLTHAGIYGIEVSIDTLAMLYDIKIDYYFRLNFEGFRNIIDSLGGVTVYSEYEFATFPDEEGYGPGYYFAQGENYLNGEQALAFARERGSLPGGDRQRGKNQMAVIRGVVQKAMSPEILTGYMSLMNALEGSFETTVPYDLIAALVRGQLEEGGDWNVVTYSVSGYGSTEVTFSQGVGAYVMIPFEEDVDTAKDLMARVRNGEIVEAPEAK